RPRQRWSDARQAARAWLTCSCGPSVARVLGATGFLLSLLALPLALTRSADALVHLAQRLIHDHVTGHRQQPRRRLAQDPGQPVSMPLMARRGLGSTALKVN